MRISWATDLHLNMADDKAYRSFINMILLENSDCLLIAGDISISPKLPYHLSQIAHDLSIPIYFVLGNHDFYQGSFIKEIKDSVHQLVQQLPDCHYLTKEEVISLSTHTALIGHDSWADGRAGNYQNSSVQLRDSIEIKDLIGLSKDERLKILEALGEEAALEIERKLHKAFKTHKTIILLTHIPPYPEAAFYKGICNDPEWSPHFVAKTVGDMLLKVMPDYPEKKLIVLCGHTHHKAHLNILPNLKVIVGEAEYGMPMTQEVIEDYTQTN